MFQEVLSLAVLNKNVADEIYNEVTTRTHHVIHCDMEKLKIHIKFNDLDVVKDIINQGEMNARKQFTKRHSKLLTDTPVEDKGNNGG